MPRQGGPAWPSAVLHELHWPFHQLLLRPQAHMHTPSLRPVDLTMARFFSPFPPRHPPQADLRCIKDSLMSRLRPSGRAAGRGRSKHPGWLYTAWSSCHTDASQTHPGLWTQLPNQNQLQGVQNVTCSALSFTVPI